MRKIYNSLFIPLARLAGELGKLISPKFRLRESGSKNSLGILDKLGNSGPKIWFHAASVGEFEQAKPVIELLKKENPDLKIIVSFFSPSGYENQKNYEFADAVIYLPFDTSSNASMLLDKMKPDAAVFVRYEFWLNYFSEIKSRGIPLFMINATIPGKTKPHDNKFLLKYYKECLDNFTEIFTTGDRHSEYFRNIDIDAEITSLSDTRFDRIMEKVRSESDNAILSKNFFDNNSFVLVASSSWEPDEEMIINAYNHYGSDKFKKLKIIFTPHEPEEKNISRIRESISGTVLLSEIESGSSIRNTHIIVDSIGKLLQLYRYADAAHIGGAFGAGVHSVTEPAGYGIPLSTGPRMKNSPDAIELNKSGALKINIDGKTFSEWLTEIMENEDKRSEYSKKAKDYVESGIGSSLRIADRIISEIKK